MTPEERGLLDDILADPADNVARLLYADWCEDHGRPERAEFIRNGIELSHLPAEDVTRREVALSRRLPRPRQGRRPVSRKKDFPPLTEPQRQGDGQATGMNEAFLKEVLG